MLKPDWMDVHGSFSRCMKFMQNKIVLLKMAKMKQTPKVQHYFDASPCSNCAKLIVAAGIARVVYEEKY